MSLPTWVDFELSERTAAVMARGLAGPSESWGTLFAHAQTILAVRTDNLNYNLGGSYDFDEWQDLIAAGRILDLSTTEYGVADQENRRSAAILAACAFGMSGTSVSARAVIHNHNLLDYELSPGELTALALSSPDVSSKVLPRLPIASQYEVCLENLVAFLAIGSDKEFFAATEALQRVVFDEQDPWAGYLLRLSRLSLAHAGRLATMKVLRPEVSKFPDGYLDSLVSEMPLLLPSQYEAITRNEILNSDQNVLIALPTGTGKTLLGELSLLKALGREPGLVCFIVPYVALGRQVAERISHRTPDNVRVHRLFGNFREPAPLNPSVHLEILIATPERFDGMLRHRPDIFSSIRCVVFDEAHILGNGQRGVRVEGILTRLKLASLRGEQVPRFVLLSAVLSNEDTLANWVGIRPGNTIRGTWRPCAKRLLRWAEDNKLRLHAGDDPLRSVPSEVLGWTHLPWPNQDFYLTEKYSSIMKQERSALENVAFLAGYEYDRYNQPVLCVCSTRSNTRILAGHLTQKFEILEPTPQSIRKTIDLIDQKHPYLLPLKEALSRGVAYHNSSLPHDVRECIEKALENRDLKAISATTTLAEGVDLPFRVAILADWLTFDGDKKRPMKSLLFKNIAGRCGRAGQFTEGDTIIFDNPVGDADLVSARKRSSLQREIFFSASQPILESAIGNLKQKNAVAMIGSQLLAAIAENRDVENLSLSFLTNSFAYQGDDREAAVQRIGTAYQEILDDTSGLPFAVAASPVRLTRLGEAANYGGFSPGTTRQIWNALNEVSEQGSSRDDLVRISVFLLKSLADVPEQENPDLRKAVTIRGSRPVVRLDELDDALNLWLDGKPLDNIFAELPSNLRSKSRTNLQDWLKGDAESRTWTDKFEKFHIFIESCFAFFLPWVLRAAGQLAQINEVSRIPWADWARYVQYGTDSTWGSSLLEDGVVSERDTAIRLSKQFEASGQEDFERIRNEIILEQLSQSQSRMIGE